MSYCLKADLEAALTADKLSRLAQNATGDPESDINANITKAITKADSEINLFVGSHYTIPLPEVPDIIKQISVELAICNLKKKKDLVDDDYEKRYKWAKDLLKDIAANKVTLDLGEDAEDEDYPEDVILNSDTPINW
jgi:phage gp36-like protein